MNENIASFENFETDAQIAAHQTGLMRVVLEGKTDALLFRKYWFPHRQDVFEFVEANDIGVGSGCTAVISGVNASTGQGIPAIGIVDRDTLFREMKWDILFGIDAASLNATPLSPGVYIAARWEVEAYLLEADSRLSDWVSAGHRTPPAPEAMCENALGIILHACQTLLKAAPYFAAKHVEGARVSESMFCNIAPEVIQAQCDAHFVACAPIARGTAGKVAGLIGIIENHQPPNDAERLPFLLQYVDTKRLFKRLIHSLEINDNFWFLATMMRREGKSPQELEALLDQAEEQCA